MIAKRPRRKEIEYEQSQGKTLRGLIFVQKYKGKEEITLTPWTTTIVSCLISAVISAVISGFIVTQVNRSIDKRQQKRDEDQRRKEKTLDSYHLLIMQGIVASLSLGEATADAVESGEYNGKQQQAREYAEKTKHELQDFAYRFSTENLK